MIGGWYLGYPTPKSAGYYGFFQYDPGNFGNRGEKGVPGLKRNSEYKEIESLKIPIFNSNIYRISPLNSQDNPMICHILLMIRNCCLERMDFTTGHCETGRKGKWVFRTLLLFSLGMGSLSHCMAQQKGMFTFGVHLSDYRFLQYAKDSSFNYALHQKTLLKSGNANFGFDAGYWRPVASHLDFSVTLGGTFSNFPSGFIKGDSLGQAGFTLYGDGLFHLKAFNKEERVNPFISAGLGGGLFGKTAAFYAPVGLGLDFHFKEGGTILLQAQLKEALSAGIKGGFLYYSLGFAQGLPEVAGNTSQNPHKGASRASLPSIPAGNDQAVRKSIPAPEKVAESIRVLPVSPRDTSELAAAIRKVNTIPIRKEKVLTMADSDSDGVYDSYDKCPTLKGSAINQGCPFPMVQDALVLHMTPDSVTYMIYFDFDRSDLYTQAFDVLYQVMEILKADTSLTVSIAGFADSKGSFLKNLRVSEERAKVTRDYLLSYDIAPSRIKWAYYGSSYPIDNNVQWRNRRVEITLIRNRHGGRSPSP